MNVDDMSEDALRDKVEELELDLDEANATIARLTQRLEDAAEVMATTRRIHNTPHAKVQWIRHGTARIRDSFLA